MHLEVVAGTGMELVEVGIAAEEIVNGVREVLKLYLVFLLRKLPAVVELRKIVVGSVLLAEVEVRWRRR